MFWKTSDVAHIFKVGRDTVKQWAYEFKEYLSPYANPGKGLERKFTGEDIQVLAYVFEYWEDEPDYECIKIGLNCEYHRDDRYLEVAHLSSPIFQEIPEGLDETWTHGVILNDAKINNPLEVARAYKYAADALVREALESSQGRSLDYPIFNTYRHCLELYLKLIGDVNETTHDLARCVTIIEQKYGEKIGGMVKKWLDEFDSIDKKGTAFRYSDDDSLKGREYWIDLYQLSTIMKKLCQLFEGVYWDNIASKRATDHQ